jgi:hypothetical protein
MKAADKEGYKVGLLMLDGMEANEAHNHYMAIDMGGW